MRIAVFSDIHGNPYACQAVLDAIAGDGHFDRVVAAGDLCYGGSDPAACVEMLRTHGVYAVFGNTDEYIINPDQMPPDELHRATWPLIAQRARWAAGRLSPSQLNWLAGLPFGIRIQDVQYPGDDLLIVHANPKNTHDFIMPPPHLQSNLPNLPPQPDDDPVLLGLLQDVTASVIAFGHLHFTSQRQVAGHTLVNVSPCSIAPYDHDRRARYTIFTRENDTWTITRRCVAYDHIQEAAALQASDMPGKAELAQYFE